MTFSNKKIRLAQNADAANIAALLNKAYRGDEAKKGWTTESDLISGDKRTDEMEVLSLIKQENSFFLLFVEEDILEGCLNVQIENNKLYLGMLSVEPSLQGKGIGKILLSEAEVFAKKNNCHTCYMTVIDERKELIDFYKRFGYNSTEERKPFPNDGKSGIPHHELWFIVLEKEL